ncbi:hypothetical protein [Actinoplanes sp. NPDC051851]|uniref:hypothetical protein n=1 Tax=Actinoplanes sp. NPDC051851 TaxID=3154753 RepID=UPI00344A0FAC
MVDDPLEPWWQEVRRAAQRLASAVGAAASRAGRDGIYGAPPGSPPPRRRRQAGSLRHLAEVIRAERLAPGLAIDKDIVARVLAGDLRYITDPTAVVAVVKAAHLIARTPFTDEDARRLTVASAHVAALVEAAERADLAAPDRVPVAVPRSEAVPVVLDGYFVTRHRPRRRWLIAAGAVVVVVAGAGTTLALATGEEVDADCRLGAAVADIVDDASAVFRDDTATRLSPTLDFDAMNGSARYDRFEGRTFYWGRAGSDDDRPHSGGARVRWKTPGGPWRSCATALPLAERGYVHSPAVATTIGGQPVTVQICLWRDEPRRENCTPEITTG